MSLFAELKRRNVFRVAAFYAAAVWALAQGIAQLAPLFGDYDWVARWFVIAAVIGFPFWIAFAWFYEFTPQGLKRESEIDPADPAAHRAGRRLDFAIIGVLAIAVVLLLTDRFVPGHGVNEGSAMVAPDNSIAVLPFTNLSSDEEQAYFADGISEELLNLLARIPQLQVTARTSSFAFKGKELGIPEIARQLHVAHVLEGSVRKSGNTVRITAQLIDAAADKHLWSQSYDRRLDDIFAIQDEIAIDVVKQLRITLLGAAPSVRETDPAAYALYLQAVQLGRQFNAEALQRSDALYRQALDIDPRYAPAWHGLSRNFTNQTNLGLLSSAEGFARAREAADQALALDPGYAPAQAALGYIAAGDNDLAAAAAHLQRALALAPGDPVVLGNSALLLNSLGRLEPALALSEALVRRDPVNLAALNNLGNAQRRAGRYDAAISSYRTVLSLSPGQGVAHFALGVALLGKGDAPGALAEIEQETSEVWKQIGLALAYHALGRKSESDTALAALIANHQEDWPYNIAYVHAYRGEADQAFTWLARAVDYADSGLAEIVGENLFAKLHSDPRWTPFLRKLGKAPEQLARIAFAVPLPDAAKPGDITP